MSINLCHVTLNATPNSKCFSLCVSQLTDCLSLPSGSAGKGGKSTETAALGREESAKQRAGDWREGDKFLFFSPYLTISFKCFWEMYEWGKTALPKLILSPTVLLHPSRCPALPFLTLFHQNSFWFVQAHKASSLAPRRLMSPVPPSLPIYQPYLILQGATKGKQNRFPPFLSCPPLITLPSLVLLFTTRDMPPRTFPKFLEIWLQEPAPRARNATAACVQKGSLCVHTCRQTHTHSSLERPVIRLCFDLDTHTEESTNDYTHTGGCSFVLWYVHQRHSLSCVPFWSTHWPLYTLHTPIAHLSVQPSQIFRKSPEVFRSHWSLC